VIRRRFERRTRVPAPAEDVYTWHARPGALERLSPPWDPPRVESRSGGIEDTGARVVLRAGPFGQRWVAEHYGAVPGREFRDRQIAGPFALWEHTHRMIPEGPDACTLEDWIEYALPAGAAGEALGGWAVRRQLARVFEYRHRVTVDDLAAHAGCRGRKAVKVAITGGSGLLGSALVPFLTTGGHEVVRLVRHAPRAKDEARWDPENGTIDAAALEGVDAVVNLSGENIAGARWSQARKELLRSSRLVPTRLLSQALAGLKRKPKVLVSVSATGYYGSRADAWLTEQDAPADDFLGRLSAEWEEATAPAARVGIRVVHPRIGVVLTPVGGALGTMLPAFRAGLGGVLAGGNQYMSWIAIDDVLGALHHLIERPDIEGAVNAVAPEPVTNAVFARTLGRVLGRPTLTPAPAFALRLAFGEMADAVLLASTRCRPVRLEASGYRYRFADLESALRHLLGRAARA
jgi:hypothetical protein